MCILQLLLIYIFIIHRFFFSFFVLFFFFLIRCCLKTPPISLHSHLYIVRLISWNLTTRCLAVSGGGGAAESASPAGFWAHYNIVMLTCLLTCVFYFAGSRVNNKHTTSEAHKIIINVNLLSWS